ncbi:hypothetical protein, partial [Burkholderia multivorans]|uniref:hypothetical protein n=1 Tax=Burkholderia multivorans TaxID=87883 RepID=UPI001C26F881
EFRVQVQALARFYRHFFLAFAWHNVAPWPSVYASHTKVRIGSFYLFCRFIMERHSIPAKHLAQAALNSPIACSIACSSVNLHISSDSQFPP